ncbi:MAG: quorum-sensing autoinducer CAI-1 synthase [Nitrococcus mobilis]|nr:quorum-sensing autoinducer CAI-1 synthase [Nitrococcus mobilis]
MQTAYAELRGEVGWEKPSWEPAFLKNRVAAYYRERVEKTWNGGHIMRGRQPSTDSVVLQSNDYLSIARHPAILRAQTEAIECTGNGLLMSAVFLQGDEPQPRLEAEFADYLGSEATVLCQSGWCANVGLVQAIADARVPVYVDMFAHMSLHQGILCAGAVARPFRHNDVDHLERQIRRHGPGIVVVDSIYSTTGDMAPLVAITEIGLRHGCVLVVDESHSLGTHGPDGAGLVAANGLADRVHFRTASLAKAFAGRAGLITCSASFAEYFKCTARPAIFSSTLLPHEIAGLHAALRVIREEEWRRQRLHRNARYLRDELSRLGYNLASHSQIIGLESGPEPQTIVLRDALESRGIFGSVFCAPATPANRSLIRLSVNAALCGSQLRRIVNACAAIREEVDLLSWASTRRRPRSASVLCR